MRLFSSVIIRFVFEILGLNPSGQYEEEGRAILKILIAFVLVLIGIILCTMLFFTKPELKEWLSDLDAEPVLTMQDFGYPDSSAPDASIYAVTYDSERAASCYKLQLSAEEGKKYIELDVYRMEADADTIFQRIVEQRVTSYRKNSYGSRNHMPDIKYDRAIEQMIELDAASWHADAAFAHNEWDAAFNNLIFVKRKSEILVVSMTGIEWTEEVKESLLHGIDQIIIQEFPE